MKIIEDKMLEKKLIKMLFDLLRNGSLPSVIERIEFVTVKNVLFLANTEIVGKKHRIFFSSKLNRISKTKRGLARTYALIAHEIGHMMHMANLATIPFKEPDLAFRVQAEGEADKNGLPLLRKVYPENAKWIMLEQAEYALKRSLGNSNASKEDIAIAKLFFEKRRSVLLANT